jgi:hypothetical protein
LPAHRTSSATSREDISLQVVHRKSNLHRGHLAQSDQHNSRSANKLTSVYNIINSERMLSIVSQSFLLLAAVFHTPRIDTPVCMNYAFLARADQQRAELHHYDGNVLFVFFLVEQL